MIIDFYRFSSMQPAKILLKSLVKIRRQFKSLLPLPLAVLLTLSQASASPTKAQDSPRRNESFPKIGLALGGGGTRGCAHIGVLRVLERERIPISCIAGTSMGAIVGGLYASGVSLDSIEDMLYSKKLLRAYDTVPIPVRIAVIPFFFIAHVIGHHPYDGLYRGNKFANFITNSVPDNRRNIENSAIPFRAIAANLLDGKTYVLSSGNIGRAIQSSSALPFLRRPVDWQGKLLVDGGVVTNLPCEQARELGADYVIAVNVDTDLITVEKKHFHKVGSVTSRAINMHLSAIDSWQMKKADLVIHPNVCNITLLSRRLDDVTVAIRAGEVATENALPALREILKKKNTGNMQLTTEGSKNTNSNNE